jgi:hypothetical protein
MFKDRQVGCGRYKMSVHVLNIQLLNYKPGQLSGQAAVFLGQCYTLVYIFTQW